MKARELQDYLGTARAVHAKNGHICVASAYINNLVALNVETGNLSYALGGRPKDTELEKICQRLESLTKEQRNYYWNGADEINEPITLYYVDDNGDVKTAITDSLDFPNVTDDGVLIYSNTHFESEKELLDYEINSTQLAIKWLHKSRAEKYKAWEDSHKMLKEHKSKLCKLELSLIEVIENEK